MKYSVCSTVYNGAVRLRESLDSILRLIDEKNFEIVVVDSNSTDGTWEILKEYAERYPNFRIIRKKCTRGMGRQIAFENAEGDYIIPVDLDTVYYPQWIELIKWYEKWEGKDKYALQAIYSGIYPRVLLEKVGGWRNLQWAEDWDLWWRLMEIDAFKWYPLVTGENWECGEKERRQVKNLVRVVYRKFINERDRFIARPEYSITTRLREIRQWSGGVSFYLFWIPVVVLSKIMAMRKGITYRDPKLVINRWFSNLVDAGIDGRKNYSFVPLPEIRDKRLIRGYTRRGVRA